MNYICKNCGDFIFRERPLVCDSCDGGMCDLCDRDLCGACKEEAENADIAGE